MGLGPLGGHHDARVVDEQVDAVVLFAGLVGLIPRQPAFGLALVIELSVAATMFLRVASSLMAIHEPPAG